MTKGCAAQATTLEHRADSALSTSSHIDRPTYSPSTDPLFCSRRRCAVTVLVTIICCVTVSVVGSSSTSNSPPLPPPSSQPSSQPSSEPSEPPTPPPLSSHSTDGQSSGNQHDEERVAPANPVKDDESTDGNWGQANFSMLDKNQTLNSNATLRIGRVAVLSLICGEFEYKYDKHALALLAFRRLKFYVLHYGYDLIIEGGETCNYLAGRPSHWLKLLLFAQWGPFYDWLLWIDADAILVKPQWSVQYLIERFVPKDRDVVVIGSSDGVVEMNTGVLLLHSNSSAFFTFVREVWNSDRSAWIFEEQGAINFILSRKRNRHLVHHVSGNHWQGFPCIRRAPKFRNQFVLHFARLIKCGLGMRTLTAVYLENTAVAQYRLDPEAALQALEGSEQFSAPLMLFASKLPRPSGVKDIATLRSELEAIPNLPFEDGDVFVKFPNGSAPISPHQGGRRRRK